MSNNSGDIITSRGNGEKGNSTSQSHPGEARGKVRKLSAQSVVATNGMEVELERLRAAGAAVQRIRLSAQRELELARQMRVKAERYRQETETKARSQAQLLISQARLATHKEIEEIIRKASAEIQKVLADIRMIRITAQEELETQQKYTNAARICALSLSLQEGSGDGAEGKEETISLQKV